MPGSRLRYVPAILIGSRFIFGPLLYFVAVANTGRLLLLLILLATMLSDIYDGVIARRLNIATAPLRVMDSRADAWFFVWVGVTCWVTARHVVLACLLPIGLEILLQIFSYGYDLVRYNRISSLHTYATKAWAFTLYLAVAGILAFHTAAFVWVAFGMGVVSFADALAIKMILPGWRHDVLSSFHARKLQQKELADLV